MARFLRRCALTLRQSAKGRSLVQREVDTVLPLCQGDCRRTLSTRVLFSEVHRAEEGPRVLDGRRGAALWLEELQPKVQYISRVLNRPPRLSVVLVGNRPDSQLYVQRKAETCQEVHAFLDVIAKRMTRS